MELKDLIPIIVSIASTITAVAALIFGIIQYKKSRKLELEKHEWERQQREKKAIEEKSAQIEKVKIKKSAREIYCDHITQKFKYLDFTGLNAILQKPLLLEEIYVKLRAKESFRLAQYQTINDFKELDKEKDKEEDEDFVTVFERMHQKASKQREPLKMVILGQPGSGKTTLMKWIALQCTCQGEPALANFTPVFIPLKNLGQDPDNTFKKKNIKDLTIALLDNENLSPTFLKEQFEANRILFLLDGLDEVADEKVRGEVIQWIQNQSIRKNALLVTSRFSGLHEAKGLKFHDAIPVFAVQDFDIADIERFLENWYKNIEVAVVGEEDEKDKAQAVEKGKSRYEDLMNIIKDESYEKLRQLAVNPLLLTIIAIVHRTRAVLPKERHKLYEECLKVMIELWNVANRKLEISFSVENSINNLSKIAVFLMKENRREVELPEIETLLPREIEDQSLHFFLKEMVLKAGLLYESEGKYGFLHLTFQEYLAAWHFHRSENQNAVLEYKDKYYWTEVFKLFVNIGNARLFFNEIIENLEEREYWQQMQLWDVCLDDIVMEDTQKEMEIKFAEKILDILPRIEYKEKNEPLIIQLFVHYPLYRHAAQFVDNGWHLFYHAKHPFVQSVGSSILNRSGERVQAELMEALKNRIDEFEKIENKNKSQLLDFIYQNNNSFILLITGRQNLKDFNFALAKLKSHVFFINCLDLHDLRYLPFLRDLRDIHDLRYLRKLRELIDILDLRKLPNLRELLNLQDLRDIPYLKYLRNLQDSRYFRYFRYLRDLQNLYIEKYEPIFKKEIDAWAENAMAKLHSLSDEELLNYFPGTSPEDLKIFRESYEGKVQKNL
jgi:DNA replication protein DnaC